MTTSVFTPRSRAHPHTKGIMAALSLSSTPVKAHTQISNGLRVTIIRDMANNTHLDELFICKLAGVDRTTYHRRLRQPDKPFSVEQGTRIYAVARVLDAATRLFNGNIEKAVAWLNQPAKALGGFKPAEMLTTGSGAEAVIDLIGRIEHGVIS